MPATRPARTLVWFRNDLRVADNPALFHAMERGEAVAVFCICHRQWRAHDVGDNRLAFLLDSLHRLAADLESLGVPFRLIDEPWFEGVPRRLVNLARSIDAGALAFNEEYPLNERMRDDCVRQACRAARITVTTHHAGTLLPPGTVLTAQGKPYTVFTPFKRRWLAQVSSAACQCLPPPRRQDRPDAGDSRIPNRSGGVPRDRVAAMWPGGSKEAELRLTRYLAERVHRYHLDRDFPAVDGTSALSPYLSTGCISARQCLEAALHANDGRVTGGNPGIATWINELIWRDFYRHVIAQFPRLSRGQAFRRRLDRLPWRHTPADVEAWKQGRTGYPLVDAAMRQLIATGWMHNRLRMLTAMFLTKHLLIDWRAGERHFMNLLVDGDFAANNGGWQWSASTGTDAAPYFRIFSPLAQARRFDPEGIFIRRWVPELADAPLEALMEPFHHRVKGYARPVVEDRAARERALGVYRAAARA